MTAITESQLEQETLGWLQDVGYTHLYGPDIAFDSSKPERANYRQVLLTFRLREAIHKLNPTIPASSTACVWSAFAPSGDQWLSGLSTTKCFVCACCTAASGMPLINGLAA